MKLHWKIIISIVLAIIVGSLTTRDSVLLGIELHQAFDFIGSVFLNALKMIVVPLIMASIITGIYGIGNKHELGRLGLKTILFYLTSSMLAIMIGLFVVNMIQPGIVDGQPVGVQLGLVDENAAVLETVKGRGAGDILNIFQQMVPSNIVEAAAQGNMLGLIFFSIMFAFFLSKINNEYKEPLIRMWQGVFDTMMLFTIWIMHYVAPIGVFGLVAKTVSETGFNAIKPILSFFITVLLALAIHVFLTLPSLIKLIGRIKNPYIHFKAMTPALLTAFSTSSSSATLPLSIECVEENAKVSNKISSFVLPLGATINMDGTALYECVAAMFLAQAYGIDISFGTQFTIVALALITSIGVAGIPAASIVAIVIILDAVGLPTEAISLIWVTDRFLDMCRTSVNIFSDSVGAVIIASTEGEKDLYRGM